MLRAIAYIRVSTDRQVTDGSSLVTQRRRVLEYVTAKGYKLVKQFIEEGESAKTDNRPVLQEMLQFCRSNKGGIDLLVFPKIDRFARYSEDYHNLKARLRELGIRVESIDERFDDSPAGKFLESMLAATAQFDNDVRSERTYNGMKEAVRQGRWVWRAPIGFRNTTFNNKKTIEPDPATARFVVEGFEKIASGQFKVSELRKWLSDHGVTVGRNAIYNMLSNKAYIGVIESFGLTVRGEPPMIPLISESLFRRASDAIQSKNYPKSIRRDNPDFALRGTVYCSCGKLLTACWSAGRGTRYPYYRCHECRKVNLRRELVEGAFLRFVTRFRGLLQFNGSIRQDLEAKFNEDSLDLVQVHKNLARERDKTQSILNSLVMKVAEGVIPDHLATQQIEELDAKLRDVTAKLNAAGEVRVEPPFEVLWRRAKEFLDQVQELWRTGNLAERQNIQRLFFPHGAQITCSTNCRTAKGGQLTGSALAVLFDLSPLVGHGDRSAKQVSPATTTPDSIIKFLHDVNVEMTGSAKKGTEQQFTETEIDL